MKVQNTNNSQAFGMNKKIPYNAPRTRGFLCINPKTGEKSIKKQLVNHEIALKEETNPLKKVLQSIKDFMYSF